jgi:hypothetical protein
VSAGVTPAVPQVLWPDRPLSYEDFKSRRADSVFASAVADGELLTPDDVTPFLVPITADSPGPPPSLGGSLTGTGSQSPTAKDAHSRVDSMFGEVMTGRKLIRALVELLMVQGLKGTALKEALERPEYEQVTGSVLLLGIFKAIADGIGRHNHADIARALAAVEWLSWEVYGTALRHVLQDDPEEQLFALVVVQKMCSFLHFPRLEGDAGAGAGGFLIHRLFSLLHIHQFIDKAVFHLWWSDNSNLDEDRRTTIAQVRHCAHEMG